MVPRRAFAILHAEVNACICKRVQPGVAQLWSTMSGNCDTSVVSWPVACTSLPCAGLVCNG
ncbi:hypothetical protein HaLaN_16074, partial [Haematococcus lacustris]